MHFKIIELTQIMKQKKDTQFANAFYRFRTGKQTEENIALIALIKTGHVDNFGDPAPAEALHIFAFNKDVNAYNEKMLNQQFRALTPKQIMRLEELKTFLWDRKNQGYGRR